VLRRGAPAQPLNPPQYTLSGWRPPAVRASAATPGASTASATTRINLNTATQEELETLPGIGPKLAERIMEFRKHTPFRSVNDLDFVSGIGPKRLEALRPEVTVE